ncbi:MAG: gliding motility-associated protein GldE [Flavobacteriia bacterium]|jgi:putative hemolysin|nr:gliding motility-associated protein GldE [Flavobacteriia bacterium]
MNTAIEPPSLSASLFDFNAQLSDATYLYLLIIFLLLLLSAFASGSESAFFSLKPKDNAALKANPSPRAKLILSLLTRPQELLATLLIFNNFVNVGIVILSSFVLNDLFPTNGEFALLRFVVEVIGITLIILLFGEVIPKIFANRNALKVSMLAAYPLRLIGQLPPLSWLKLILVRGTNFIQKLGNKSAAIDQNELEQAVALTKDEAGSKEEHKILEGIVRFGKTEASEIMTPRVEVEDIEASDNFKAVLAKIIEVGYSRIPVFDESPDNIIGILYIKDLLNHLNQGEDFDWKQVLRKPFFVPENKKINDLLQEFRNMKMHMAVVVDEYGGASGIITLEDILEEIVGDITDEFDDTEIQYTKQADNTYLFEGRTSLNDLLKIIGEQHEEVIENARGEAETLGGLVIEVAGRILKNNEYITLGPLKLIVESSDKKRVKSVKVIVHEN